MEKRSNDNPSFLFDSAGIPEKAGGVRQTGRLSPAGKAS
jgi:hypothetical protein